MVADGPAPSPPQDILALKVPSRAGSQFDRRYRQDGTAGWTDGGRDTNECQASSACGLCPVTRCHHRANRDIPLHAGHRLCEWRARVDVQRHSRCRPGLLRGDTPCCAMPRGPVLPKDCCRHWNRLRPTGPRDRLPGAVAGTLRNPGIVVMRRDGQFMPGECAPCGPDRTGPVCRRSAGDEDCSERRLRRGMSRRSPPGRALIGEMWRDHLRAKMMDKRGWFAHRHCTVHMRYRYILANGHGVPGRIPRSAWPADDAGTNPVGGRKRRAVEPAARPINGDAVGGLNRSAGVTPPSRPTNYSRRVSHHH